MSGPPEPDILEARLIREIGAIDQQLNELRGQRQTLETLLLKARREGVAARTVSRRNSVPRILIEEIILGTLKASKRPVRSQDLYRAALARDPTLKEVTFRSHLHRLSKRASIKPVPGRRGQWAISE